MRKLWKIWKLLGLVISWVLTRAILIIFYYFALTPIALIAKLFGKRFLDLKFDKSAGSYWINFRGTL